MTLEPNDGLPVSAVLEIDEEGQREAEKRVVKQPSAVGALWAIPALYGVLLLAVSAWWLVVGEPFDHGTYERIGEAPWDVMMGPSHPPSLPYLPLWSGFSVGTVDYWPVV